MGRMILQVVLIALLENPAIAQNITLKVAKTVKQDSPVTPESRARTAQQESQLVSPVQSAKTVKQGSPAPQEVRVPIVSQERCPV